MATSQSCHTGAPAAAEAADDSAKAPATVPPLEAWGAAPDLEEPSTQDKDEDGHPHNHIQLIHEENNNPNGRGAQPDAKTRGEKTPPDAADADSPGMRARTASNKRPPSEGDAARRRRTRKQSAFDISRRIMLDPASVIDHEARQMQWSELFNEALKSYRDVTAAAAVVSWVFLWVRGCWVDEGVRWTISI